jgi:hypothetical protein
MLIVLSLVSERRKVRARFANGLHELQGSHQVHRCPQLRDRVHQSKQSARSHCWITFLFMFWVTFCVFLVLQHFRVLNWIRFLNLIKMILCHCSKWYTLFLKLWNCWHVPFFELSPIRTPDFELVPKSNWPNSNCFPLVDSELTNEKQFENGTVRIGDNSKKGTCRIVLFFLVKLLKF